MAALFAEDGSVVQMSIVMEADRAVLLVLVEDCAESGQADVVVGFTPLWRKRA